MSAFTRFPCLKEAAERVFERYQEAAERVETALAEKLLRMPSLRAVTARPAT